MTKPYKCRVEYLESTGTQYIDTGFPFKSSTDEIEMRYTVSNTTSGFTWGFGSLESGATYGMSIVDGPSSSQSRFSFNGTTSNLPLSDQMGSVHKITLNSDGIYNDGELKRPSYSYVIDGTWNNYLFALSYQEDGTASYFCRIKIYNYQHKRNGILIRDFIPVLDNSDVPAMYDKVSGQLFYNKGTGNFSYGKIISEETNKKLLRKKLALMLATLKKKRKYYCEVEYIESVDTQWIETNYPMGNINKIECILDWTQHNTTHRDIMGGGTSGSYSFEVSVDGYYGLGYNNYSNVQPQAKDKLTWIWGGDGERPKLYINDTLVCTDTLIRVPSGTFKTAISSAYVPHCKIYCMRIYNFDNDLVRDLIPVLDWNYVPCMYDRVTEQLFYNAGTGDFTAGREIHPVDYLESSGTQWIDTGINPENSNTHQVDIETNFAILTPTSDQYTGIFGAAVPRFGFYTRYNNMCFGYYTAFDNLHEIEYGKKYNLKYSVTKSNQNATLDGVNVWAATRGEVLQNTYTIGLFCRNYSTPQWRNNARIYNLTIAIDGTLVRNFIPMVDENGVGAMFDRVSHTIFDNAGTGQFIPASYQLDGNGRVVEPEYE